MSKLLYIKATPKTEQNSWTLKLSTYFLTRYQQRYPDVQITELDLYQQNIAYLSELDLQLMMQEDKGEFSVYVDQFLAHDKYVIAAPFWNFSFPAIFKAYLDRIITIGKTFQYSEQGIQPLISNRPALLFMARGETPSDDREFAMSYWQSINRYFLGLKSHCFLLDGTDVLSKDIVKQRFNNLITQIDTAVDWF